MTDFQITESLRKGKQSGIKWLYDNYYIGLCTYAFRFTKNKEAAEETVQMVFFKIWEIRNNLEIKESIIAYLYRAVRNNCLNYIKHQQIVNKYHESLSKNFFEIEEHLTISNETGLSIYLAKELETKINEAIENLPVQCREIFKMSRYEGLKHNEIADIKGITLNTVQKQISIALDKLKISLRNYISTFIFFIINALNQLNQNL